MKISELTPQQVKQYARIRNDADDEFIKTVVMPAALGYIAQYTGLDEESIDAHEEFVLAYLALRVHYYDNRGVLSDSDKLNRIVEDILNMHSTNLM